MRRAGAASTKQAFATQLWHLADLVQAADRRRSFRARAYRRAVWSLDGLSPQLEEPPEEIMALPGIGAGIASLIEQFRQTGRLEEHERLQSIYPNEARRIARLPRMTPGRQQFLKGNLGIDRIDQLLEAIQDGGAEIPGVGATTAQLWKTILADRPSFSARPITEAASFAHTLARHLKDHLPEIDIGVGGQIARFDDWVEKVELNVPANDLEVTRHFLLESALTSQVASTEPLEVETPAGMTVRLVSLTDRARRALNLTKEFELRGDLHLHTTWSGDGHLEPSQLVDQAQMRGYSYLAITDHTIGLRMGGLDRDALARQRRDLEELTSPDLWVMQGAELNIDRVGGLDLDDAALADLDFAIAAVHSFFSLHIDEQTERIIRAIEHPAVRVIAHLTGRRIGIRPSIELHLEPIFKAATRTGTALEVNGHLDRLDLSVEMVSMARDSGVLFSASSDAHRLNELDNTRNSAGILRRAGVEPERVINTWPLAQFKQWVETEPSGRHSGAR